jgi:hypothetical protein
MTGFTNEPIGASHPYAIEAIEARLPAADHRDDFAILRRRDDTTPSSGCSLRQRALSNAPARAAL